MTEPAARQPAGEAERYRTLLEINNALIANLTREALFRAIAAALRPIVPFDRTAVFLHDSRRDVLRLFVASKFFEHFVYIAHAMDDMRHEGLSLWDEADGFC